MIKQLPDTTRLLIDASSVIKACCYAGQDAEFGKHVTFEGKRVWINSADHGYDIFMQSYANMLERTNTTPHQTVLVLDGMDANRYRRHIYGAYKGNRPPLPQEQYDAFKAAIKGAADELMRLGAIVVQQDYTEADDVIAYLCKHLRGRLIIWSRDKDMLALRAENVDVWRDTELNPQIHVSCPNRFVTLFKALVGDTSDNIPGAKGFGEKAFLNMMLNFSEDDIAELESLVANSQLDQLDVSLYKPFKKVVEHAETVYSSWACAKFYPEIVNTCGAPLRIRTSIIQDRDGYTPAGLRKYAGERIKVEEVSTYQRCLRDLKESPFVSLDIETATPPESDEWLAAIKETKKSGKLSMVDVFGSFLVSLSITCGKNVNHTYYFPVKHADSVNLSSEQVMELVCSIPEGIPVAIHNTSFELSVLYNEWGGWIEGAVDTMIMKSYVDENTPLGLKYCSQAYLNYTQVTYEEVTQGRKMDQLTTAEAFAYGCDDTVCTTAIFNRFRFIMELEHTIDAFEQVELPAQYWVAQTFIEGFEPDLQTLAELERDDWVSYRENEEILNEYLLKIGWEGATFKPIKDLSPKTLKEVFYEIAGQPLNTKVRKLEKIALAVAEQGQPELADAIQEADIIRINEIREALFEPKPDFEVSRDADLRKLCYDTWNLPIRFRTKVTAAMRKKGIRKGTPQADVSAIDHMIALDLLGEENEEKCKILKIIRATGATLTRQGLYYTPYPVLTHWKDGKIHPQLGQSMAATRRFTPKEPNVNQLPKKGEGLKVRNVIKAPPGFIVVSFDFSGQELRLAAEASGDIALTSCYVGENLRDPHSLTGAGIAAKKNSPFGDYELFEANRSNVSVKEFRDKGKGVNFSSQYLCRAPKLAKMLIIDTSDAQVFLDAKNEVFYGLAKWQQDVSELAHIQGYVTTMLGARRHLYHKLIDPDKFVVAEAERQSVNFTIQASGGEMTKLAANAMQDEGLFESGDVHMLFPVHDELDFFVRESQATIRIPQLHRHMIRQYADMKIPLESECKIGRTFGALVTVGKNPTPSAIMDALAKLPKEKTCETTSL